VLSAEVFLAVWKKVFAQRRYLSYDFVVKADVDTVFLPQLLRAHLSRHLYISRSSPATRVYMSNCQDGLRGPLEILSRGAAQAYDAGVVNCERRLRHELEADREEAFLRQCLDFLGVGRVDDFGLLSDASCPPSPQSPLPCTTQRVSYHPLASPAEYFECLAQAGEKVGR